MITIKLNGTAKQLKKGTPLISFLGENGIKPAEVAVELNFEIIYPQKLAGIILKNGDVLEVLRFVGGG